MPENFAGTEKRGSDIGAKPETKNELSARDAEDTRLYDNLKDPRDLIDGGWREPGRDDDMKNPEAAFLDGGIAEAREGAEASSSLIRPENRSSLEKIDELRREISGNIGAADKPGSTTAENGPELSESGSLLHERRKRAAEDSIQDAEAGNARREKEPKIPSSVYKRLAVRISKFLNRDAGNAALNSNAALDIIHGMGVKEGSPIFERIKRHADLLLDMKGRHNRDENREIARTQKEYQESGREEKDRGRMAKIKSREAAMDEIVQNRGDVSDSVRQNKGDIRWTDNIKDYIKELEGDEDAAASFWKNFEYVYRNRTTKNGEKLDEGSMKRTETGVITEIAAERLFLGWKDFMAKEAQSENGIKRIEDLANIDFAIEKATPEEDATKKTDFFVSFAYGGEKIRVPVQVKSDYFKEGWDKGEDYSEEDIICYHAKKPRENSRIDVERIKFFAENPVGFYLVLSHGHDGLSISPGGKASRSMQSLFNRRMASVLPGLLNKMDNMKEFAEKEQRDQDRS